MSTTQQLSQSTDLFHDLSDEELEIIASAALTRRLGSGDSLCSKGEEGQSLFVIVSGALNVTRSAGGAPVPLATLRPGESCGEMSITTGGPRVADLVAVEDSEVLEITRARLDQALAGHPRMAGRFWHSVAVVLARRLERTNNLVAEYVDINKRLIEDDEFRRFYATL